MEEAPRRGGGNKRGRGEAGPAPLQARAGAAPRAGAAEWGSDSSESGGGLGADELYDAELDDMDELFVEQLRPGQAASDAVLSCPGCFATVCTLCQRHATRRNQFRAIDVGSATTTAIEYRGGEAGGDGDGGRLLEVHCSCCDTFLGVKDEGGVFHLFHVIPAAA